MLGGPGLWSAEAKPGRNGLRDFSQRLFAALDVHECAGGCFRDGQRIKRRDIGDMYIRPTVQSASDVPCDPGCLGLARERGDLDALRRSPQSIAVEAALSACGSIGVAS